MVDGTGTVPLEIWAMAAVAVRLMAMTDKVSNLMGISFGWKFLSLLLGCASESRLLTIGQRLR
jgi:hypothetical protein